MIGEAALLIPSRECRVLRYSILIVWKEGIMGFRTVEITGPAELHVRSGSLIIEKELKSETNSSCRDSSKTKKQSKKIKDSERSKIQIPLEDINTIVCMGAAIRISTMAMAQICANKISMTMLDEKYRPAGILTAYEANSKQSLIMRKQAYIGKERAERLWERIVRAKIQNQADALDILGLPDAERVKNYISMINRQTNIDAIEAGAAKEYFAVLCPDIIRREESPINSRLNYGYSVIRNTIIRASVAAGLLPSFGIHHQNLYNAYNLADDLIEPFRPSLDVIAYRSEEDTIKLSREERKQLASVLQNAVIIGNKKVPVLQAIDLFVSQYRDYILEEREEIDLPIIAPTEIISQIRE